MTHTKEELQLAKESFLKNGGSWFQVEGKPSIHREVIFGYEPTYDGH